MQNELQNKLEKLKGKIVGLEEASAMVRIWHFMGLKVVFTNGVFDVLHRGHVDYLARAASLGHRMVVGLNTDQSVRALKGASRPVQDETSRAMVLASLFCVDAVVLFSENTPYELIKAIEPDILVKGSDYSIDKIVGADLVMARGGRVETMDFIDGYSSSIIVERIKSDKGIELE
jgi:rfaE bifunctional protein nucleotidyltransferase chain/domain